MTTGTINPGILWEGKYCQIGAEAVIPVNAHTGPNIGAVVQVQIFIDDLFPKVFGHPIFQHQQRRQQMNIIRSLLIIVTVTLAPISLAQAHAFLDHADPRVGSTGACCPAQVTVYMTEGLGGRFRSKLQVFDAKGTEVDKKDVKVSGATMTVSVPTLGVGTYKVIWKAVATDTHRTSGTFDCSFTVQ